jgi:hypothetical protein
VICICLLASGCYLLSGVIVWAAPAESAPAQVWVARRGWRIDLGLAVDGLNASLTSVAAHFPAAPGPYQGSLYFEALLRYSGLHTCNTWAAEGLAAAQLPSHRRFVVLAEQLWSQAKKLKHRPDRALLGRQAANRLLTVAAYRPDRSR